VSSISGSSILPWQSGVSSEWAKSMAGKPELAQAAPMARASVLHPLDDIDGLFLADPERRPSMAVNEDTWLNNAEFVLTLAEREYERLDMTIAEYGDPENVRTIG
jgi:hypothetical protein